MLSLLRPAAVLFAALTLICGLFYPFIVAGIGQVVFPSQAQGSLILLDGKLVGSSLIGQAFTSPKYFWGRPSATSPMPNNAMASGGANLGPTNPALLAAVKSRIMALKAVDPNNKAPIPVDLVTASGSGLDPEISVAAALYQLDRIARERKLTTQAVRSLIAKHEKPQYFGFFGEPRVNVLALNLALDHLNNASD